MENPSVAIYPKVSLGEIMMINGIDDKWKVLLMMGIGVFATDMNPDYVEIMKDLADTQQLFLIIASTDYIYGTNYQFCHGYTGDDDRRLKPGEMHSSTWKGGSQQTSIQLQRKVPQ